MTQTIKILIAICLSSLPLYGGATPPNWRAVDATNFDIADIKLGMSYGDVIDKIAAHFQLSSVEKKNLAASTSYTYSEALKANRPAQVVHRKNGNSISVIFSVRIPIDRTNPVAASEITYSIPSTPENTIALKEAALAKYGQPSDDRKKSVLMWCSDYNQMTQCEPMKAKLQLTLSSLTLDYIELGTAEAKYIQGLMKTPPKI